MFQPHGFIVHQMIRPFVSIWNFNVEDGQNARLQAIHVLLSFVVRYLSIYLYALGLLCWHPFYSPSVSEYHFLW